MEKKMQSVKHRILYGYSFYPITYKGKKYVIEITEIRKNYFESPLYIVDIYEYKEKKTLFKGRKGESLCAYNCREFTYKTRPDEDATSISYIYSSGFRQNYPYILKNILEEMERKLAEEKAEEKILRKIRKWDGVVDNLFEKEV